MTTTSSRTDDRTHWKLLIDLETYSSGDISAGVHKYVEAPDFDILLLAYAWDDGPVQVIDLTRPWDDQDDYDREETVDIFTAIRNPDVIKVAHNAAFERACLSRYLRAEMPLEEWEDTMILCAMNGLPQSLDAAGAALQLKDQKIKEGSALIRYFCSPCKPTVANGGRTRNLPEHAPDKWARFVEYCCRDVEVEQAIYYRLRDFPVPDWEREVQVLDAHINERGVLIDTDLAASAIAVDEQVNTEHTLEMRSLTGLDNPGSVAQLKDWLTMRGIQVDSLGKATVSDLLTKCTDPLTRRVLELRQQLGKTSTKKYQTMLASACEDHRVRGIMQYYGAGRTGRWAGRIVQPQNLPQNHLADIADVRELVRERDVEMLEMLYDNVPDVLSQLIRTALIAKPGHTFLVADYSAIEARVIAYLAGEQWRMDVFAQGGDIYCSSASQMFKVPVVKHGVNGHLRQKGKIAELACIAEGQLVLTDQGLVPIEAVTRAMKVWDGVEWVSHDGVIYRGEKEVLHYGGLEATEDHVVWAQVRGQKRPVFFGDAAACGAHLVQTGYGRHPVRLGRNHWPGKAMEPDLESLLCADPVQRVRDGAVAAAGQSEARKVKGMPKLQPEESGAQMAGQAIYRSETTLHESERRKLQELWSAGHRIPVPECNRGLSLHDRDAGAAGERDGAGPDRRQRPLRAGEPPLGDTSGELPKPEEIPRKVRVYDILNAGPRHRFTVSHVLVHNCGYGGGVGALKAFGADKMGLSEEEMQDIVTQWRQASPTIPRFWRDAEQAAKNALRFPGKTYSIACGPDVPGDPGWKSAKCSVKYRRDADALRCRLPSGRLLSYWGARLEDNTIVFMGQNQTNRKWEQTETWGGKLVENIVQAFARDCLAVALLRLDAAGYKIVFHVHDEVIAEAPEGSRWEDMAEIMGQPIDWAPGLLLRGDGYSTKFYMKD